MENKPEQSIPYTETHIITKEDLMQAYYEGYMAGLRRSLYKHINIKREAKDGKNSTSDL